MRLFELLVAAGQVPSKSETRPLVQQGAVSLDGERAEDPALLLRPGEVLVRVGKRRYGRVRLGAA